MRNRRVLLTGATGFLGSHLAKALIDQGCELVALKRKSSDLSRIASLVPDIAFFDIEDMESKNPFQSGTRIDAVIHTATNYGRNGESPSKVFAANSVFPLKLLETAVDSGVEVFINTDTILDKYLNLYSLSKNQFLQWGKYFSQKNHIHFVNLRLEHLYGPGDDSSKFTSCVINSCLANTASLKLTPGEQRRDFIYIDDVVSAYLLLLAKLGPGRKWFEEFEVGSGKAVSIREFVETVHRITGSKTNLEFGAIPYRNGEVMNSQANISALQALGWKCTHNLEQGLRLTIEGSLQ